MCVYLCVGRGFLRRGQRSYISWLSSASCKLGLPFVHAMQLVLIITRKVLDSTSIFTLMEEKALIHSLSTIFFSINC